MNINTHSGRKSGSIHWAVKNRIRMYCMNCSPPVLLCTAQTPHSPTAMTSGMDAFKCPDCNKTFYRRDFMKIWAIIRHSCSSSSSSHLPLFILPLHWTTMSVARKGKTIFWYMSYQCNLLPINFNSLGDAAPPQINLRNFDRWLYEECDIIHPLYERKLLENSRKWFKCVEGVCWNSL